ncbi:carboxymuconolactone decarboxylase family protein [Rhodococcus sp. D2-41]|uniref:Carboxymuconolactone decarboxylase family protein n=1 Tax=Speluncibacter jeojiensis TaxID=2710754 RepID=A0A9X4RFM1_9ACTN|nr:carboxymuconolactone decarboxylase family protein [Rhodococcus sp. D2-41]MDG3010658.1 carboxymuconolactone decarboxylase family protein [Rhodococcus sp. D2-41]MDG3016838.1 carboxymuconolactone decarboxylase family protein [Corynebacteriales bacterium D3-21]
MSDNGSEITETRRRGVEMMNQVYGWEMPANVPGDFFAVTADHLFADIWNRPGLSVRDRRLLLLGAITAQGQTDVAKIQINAALGNEELTEQQVEEAAIFLCHYVGWPLATGINNALIAVKSERRRAAKGK